MAKSDAQSGARTRQQAISKALAEAHRHLKKAELVQADGVARQVSAADPLNLEALMIRGRVAEQIGQFDEAARFFKKALGLNPKLAEAHAELGQILARLGQFRDAEGHLRDAMTLQPKSAQAYLAFGNLCRDQGRMIEADAAFTKALRLKPTWVEGLNALALVKATLGDLHSAEMHARRAVKLEPKHALAHSALAAVLTLKGEAPGALAGYTRAIDLAPQVSSLRIDCAASLASFGMIEEAIDMCREVLKLWPDHVAALAQIARLKRFTSRSDPDFAPLERLARDKNCPGPIRLRALFGAGKAFQDLEEYAAAFSAFVEANRISRKQFSYASDQSARQHRDITAAYSAERVSELGNANCDDRPIFVVGMPRSGTSLTERILAAHSGVAGAGELGAMNRIASQFTGAPERWSHAAAMERATATQVRQLADIYRSAVSVFDTGSRRVVDKMPANYMYIGLIKIMFPNASVVQCQRDMADTSLSIFKTHFSRGNLGYAYQLDELAEAAAHYQDLMSHWLALFPNDIHVLDYDRLTADGETEIRRLLDYCGLEWQDRVMSFHTMPGSTPTASVAQVRRPLNRDSIGIARRYADAALPLFEALQRAGVR